MFRILRITGDSLAPAYRDGDFVLIATGARRLQVGDTVVFRHPRYGTLIKRIAAIQPDGSLWVIGSHPRSVDSRTFGPVPRAAVLGRVRWHIRRT